MKSSEYVDLETFGQIYLEMTQIIETLKQEKDTAFQDGFRQGYRDGYVAGRADSEDQ